MTFSNISPVTKPHENDYSHKESRAFFKGLYKNLRLFSETPWILYARIPSWMKSAHRQNLTETALHACALLVLVRGYIYTCLHFLVQHILSHGVYLAVLSYISKRAFSQLRNGGL